MRLAALSLLFLACACGRPATDVEADTAAVYEAFLGRAYADYPEQVVLQDVTVPVHVEFVSEWRKGARRDEVSREFSPGAREALQDLVDRSRTPRPLTPSARITRYDVRISEDSAQEIQRRNTRLFPDAVVVQLSAVGFSRDGSIAAVYEQRYCGFLCGGASVTLVRRHPVGWIPAEQVVGVLY